MVVTRPKGANASEVLLPPPFLDRGRDYISLSVTCHASFPIFFIIGYVRAICFILSLYCWVCLKKQQVLVSNFFFFSLSSMHNKMGKCVNSLWFFYLRGDFLNGFEYYLWEWPYDSWRPKRLGYDLTKHWSFSLNALGFKALQELKKMICKISCYSLA